MPVLAPGQKGGLNVYNAGNRRGTGPVGERVSFFWDTRGHGVPRFDDLVTIRALETTHTVSLPMDVVKAQITTTPFLVRPRVDNPTTKHQRACDEITTWLNGGFNPNRESFDHLLKQWVGDILSIDAGVLELVPDEKGWLSEMYARDGATFTKALDQHGRFPPAGSDNPAYWQFPMHRHARPLQNAESIEDLIRTTQPLGFGFTWRPPIPFSRDQIVWTEENPASWRAYGYGRVQRVARLTEILVNQDVTNLKHFTANEIPEGVLALAEAGQDGIQRFREYWKDEVQGQQHKLPIVGGKVEWIPFRAMLSDLQFLESQKWYNQLVWMVWGLNQNEVGDVADVNRSTAQEQATTVWRRTTRPLLELLAQEINNDILPFHPAYRDIAGEVEFTWEMANPDVLREERHRQQEDLEYQVLTINEVRVARGLDPLPWGDMPLEAMRALARAHPEWVAETWGNVENPPEATGGGLFLNAKPSRARRVAREGAPRPFEPTRA